MADELLHEFRLFQIFSLVGEMAHSEHVRTCRWGYRGLSGFGHRLQLICCSYLLTLSEYFRVGWTFGVGWIPILAFAQEADDEARRCSAYRMALRWGHRSKVSQVRWWLVLVEFQDRYNTRRWGGLYTNAKHWGKWACVSEGSRVHTKLATAGLERILSAWVITIWRNDGWCFDERTGTSPKC